MSGSDPMTGTVFLAIIGAAVMHAAWNALLKSGTDKTLGMAAVTLGHVPLGLLSFFFVPLPALDSYPYIIGGILLHFGYQLFLIRSYQLGDLTQVYPIARGSAPLLVTLASITVLSVALSGMQVLAVIIIGAGIISLAFAPSSDGARNGRAAGVALVTGCFIAGYSVVDGLGARAAGTSLGYFAVLVQGNGLLMILYLALRSPQTFRALPRDGRNMFFIGGSTSFLSFAIVTWAFTQAPIALVTALRETSVIFALIIGAVFLNERLGPLKIMSTVMTVIGALLLRYAQG